MCSADLLFLFARVFGGFPNPPHIVLSLFGLQILILSMRRIANPPNTRRNGGNTWRNLPPNTRGNGYHFFTMGRTGKPVLRDPSPEEHQPLKQK